MNSVHSIVWVVPSRSVPKPSLTRASLTGFTPDTKTDITISLGVASDLDFTLKVANVAETITVVGHSDPVFSSGRTGAATAVMREELATLPTISGRITDITRLTPQYGGSGTFAGQDNRANNMTVDGSYFNNSFGLGVTTGGIGDRTGVAPISLEAIEQVQVSVAPYDVRQGNFIGAGVNTVTRSGTNSFTGSGLPPLRATSRTSAREAAGQAVQPGHVQHDRHRRVGRRPDRQEQAVLLRRFEKQDDTRPLTTFTSNPGRRAGRRQHDARPRVGSERRSAASCSTNFNYDTGPFDNIPKITPGQAVDGQGRLQRQQRQQGHVPLQPARLEQPTSASRVVVARHQPRQTNTTQFLTLRQLELRDSREPQVGRRRVELGVRQH